MLRVIFQPHRACWAAAGEDAAKWLTEFLGKPVRLVRYVGKLLSYCKDPQWLSTDTSEALCSYVRHLMNLPRLRTRLLCKDA